MTVSVYNISGQELGMKRQELSPGQHTFQLKFPFVGLYVVSVQTNDGGLSFKAACMGVKMQECRIEYAGSESPKQLKSTLTGKTLGFTFGDFLHYLVHSGNKNTIVTDSPAADKVYSVEFYECIDPIKKNYPVVIIENKVWMAKNLAYLPSVSPPTQDLNTTPYWYVYGYGGTDAAAAKANPNYSSYGVLYNWSAALTACPSGWHLPSDAEWTALSTYLGGECVAEEKMKETGILTGPVQIPALPTAAVLRVFLAVTLPTMVLSSTLETAVSGGPLRRTLRQRMPGGGAWISVAPI